MNKKELMKFENNIDYARHLDDKDELKSFRERFYIPMINGKESIYFNGNSLGLQPKTTQDYILNELEDWANFGGEGHFHARNPWVKFHEGLTDHLCTIVGALPHEVVAMNQLTVNLHLLMVTFYQPTAKRYKIICEAKAFPSDQYAFESQVKFHGFSYEDAVIEVSPRENEFLIRTEDILKVIAENKDSVAIVLFGGINYYTGQVFDIKAITEAAHAVGAFAGFDLAHAAGNIALELHEWNVDFASWCSYKYLNSGPGGVSGIYIHEQYARNPDLPRFAGWWGYDKDTRFKMEKGFHAIPTAEGWQLSNGNVLTLAAHKASLEIFTEAGMKRLQAKGAQLSSYMIFVLEEINSNASERILEIITPKHEKEKGCQVSMLMLKDGKRIFDALKKHGVISDWREPNVIRVAPVPLYNSFQDIYRFGEILGSLLTGVSN